MSELSKCFFPDEHVDGTNGALRAYQPIDGAMAHQSEAAPVSRHLWSPSENE